MKWTIPYRDREWDYDDARVTASEARLQKRLTGGLRPMEADAARLEMDPEAWIAGLAIARKRAGVPVDEAVDIDDEALDITAIFDRTREVIEAQVAAKKARGDAGTGPDDDVPTDVADADADAVAEASPAA